jgi:two-component system sensor histidine kinase BarA
VECVGNGLNAVDGPSKSHFDVILMDLQMPGLDGLQTAERIRKSPGYLDPPIIAATAICSNDYRDRCVSSGMQDFTATPSSHPGVGAEDGVSGGRLTGPAL